MEIIKAHHSAIHQNIWQMPALTGRATDDLNAWLSARYRGKAPRFTQTYDNLSAVQQKVYDDKGANLKAWTVLDMGYLIN
ncbi:bifunctional enterobactin receptor/adhesin protein [Citrobacter koseri]|uniref:Bifunctional enterobactin receptor/adhesin protein n=1 Tax=Citrobacter koseri TaxID=545 RepID=A0A2X2XTF9_CITKO|nr:bifunctional enterobactin receptor/adhesin protein [Citrobacter koseri]